MGRVIVTNFVSLDGVVQSPNAIGEDRDGGFDRGGWVPPLSDATVEEFMRSTTTGAGALLLGRRTFEIMQEAWSGEDDTEPAVAAMNRMTKYVVTGASRDLTWHHSERVEPDLARSVPRLARRVDRDLVVFGSAALVRALARHDLVDEYRLLLFPVVLGGGKRMFDESGALASFELIDSVATTRGVSILTFLRSRS